MEKKKASITYDPRMTTAAELAATIDDMGFEATLDDDNSIELSCLIRVEGMTCMSCVRNIEGVVLCVDYYFLFFLHFSLVRVKIYSAFFSLPIRNNIW